MNEDLANIHFSPIRDYKYAQWFEEVQYNGKTLSDVERREFVAVIDETIAQYSEGLPLMHDTLEKTKDLHDEYHEIERTVVSMMLFVLLTMIDSMVASKYYILADGDYDRRFKARLKRNAAHRRWYRKTHPKKYKGKRRGPKPKRRNEKFRPETLSNGDTLVELLTRSKYALMHSCDKWSERMKARMKLLFKLFPKLKEAYDIVNKLRAIFRSWTLTKETARPKLHEWYQLVTNCTLREVKSARGAIKDREDNVLNYFINHATNATPESLNSKLKSFRAQVRGVSDLPFFMYRVCKIYG